MNRWPTDRGEIRPRAFPRMLRHVLLAVSMAASVPAAAASFPWKDAVFSYQAKSTALSRMLEDIFVTQQRPVQISETVKDLAPVSGDFRQAPRQIFNDLAQSYGLVGYFDGTAMHVTALAENRTVLRPLTKVSADDVRRAALEFGYLDSRFRFNAMSAPSAVQLNGPPAYIERVSDLIALMEANATRQADGTQTDFRVIPLKNAWAEDVTYHVGGQTTVVRGVANTLRRLVDGLDGLDGEVARDPFAATPGLPASPERRPRSALSALFDQTSPDGDRQEARPPLPEPEVATDRASGADLRLSRRPGASIRIVGDSRTNAVIVMAPVAILPKLEAVVRDLDVEPELVQIEAAIIDVQDGALKEIGFDWALQASRFRIASTTSGASIGRDLPDAQGTRGSGPNFSIFGGSGALNFLSRIHALQTQGKASILSRPKLATLNGNEAVLTNQQVFYPRVSSERAAQLYQIDVGLQMRVVPAVVRKSDGAADVRLQVFIEDGMLSSRRVDELPVTSRSTITTQAIVRDGESLLIGGYVRDANDGREAKVPLLGDIPLLGALFRFRSTQVDRQERLFLITPKLLGASDSGDAHPIAGANGRERALAERFCAAASAGKSGGFDEPECPAAKPISSKPAVEPDASAAVVPDASRGDAD
ncbi:type III secretion system outer membrane ring subunit SctC [Burkholderia humptydooensis]|uniref:type III secretion system outer membrane ring subunit SctC n=2 Tax=Burkholderia humptydooensis TaxID=430531 RepID=UPI001FCFCB54|nr:type III secretion system outer membrane ring subunit SctC [Burkholderia humptydooensis]